LSPADTGTRAPAPHAFWDASLGASGGFSADLRLLVMKLRRQNVAISKISALIALFVDHFEIDVDLSRLPSTRTLGRIVQFELDILANAHLGFETASHSDSIGWGHDASSLRTKKLLTNQVCMNHNCANYVVLQ
jgi:hypothetical protein